MPIVDLILHKESTELFYTPNVLFQYNIFQFHLSQIYFLRAYVFQIHQNILGVSISSRYFSIDGSTSNAPALVICPAGGKDFPLFKYVLTALSKIYIQRA